MEQEAMQAKSVGTILREARLAKGITVEDVEAATNIRSTFITYLENEEYDKTPGEFFVKGAIRTYGNFLGLDGLKLVETYKASAGGKALHEVESQGIREAHNVTMKLQLKEKRDIGSGTGKLELPDLPWKQIGMGVAALALLGVLYFAVPAAIDWSKSLGDKTAQVTASITSSVTNSLPSKDKDTAEKAQQAPIYDKLLLELEATDKCWLEVDGDGKRLAEIMLYPGDKKTYEAKEKLIVKYGSVGAVKILVNGKDLTAVGEKGVAVKHYTLENLNNPANDNTKPVDQQPDTNKDKE